MVGDLALTRGRGSAGEGRALGEWGGGRSEGEGTHFGKINVAVFTYVLSRKRAYLCKYTHFPIENEEPSDTKIQKTVCFVTPALAR